MSDADIRAAVVAERRDQAELLAGLTDEQWNHATLCAGWRVREVIAHTTLPFRQRFGGFLLDLLRAGGRINAAADRRARADAARLTPAELLECLRANLEHPWTPPGGGPQGALSHDVIHGLDWTEGLGLDRAVPVERVAIVVRGMKPKNLTFFGVDLDGVRLEATDLDWTLGDGQPVRGRVQDLLLVACGRPVPPGRLDGEPARRFTA